MNKPFIVRARTSSGIYSSDQLQDSDVGEKAVAYLLCLPNAVVGAVLQVTEAGVEWVLPAEPEPEEPPNEFLGDASFPTHL